MPVFNPLTMTTTVGVGVAHINRAEFKVPGIQKYWDLTGITPVDGKYPLPAYSLVGTTIAALLLDVNAPFKFLNEDATLSVDTHVAYLTLNRIPDLNDYNDIVTNIALYAYGSPLILPEITGDARTSLDANAPAMTYIWQKYSVQFSA